jgi:lambda family phage minor tail protein L
MAIPISELQSLGNKSIIELYSVTLFSDLHGQSSVTRFHSGVNMNSNASIVWQGNTYSRFPAIADGFEFSGQGTLPRPTLVVSNILGTISALMQTVNATTPFNDLQGAKFIRHRTMAQFLDAVNFPNNINPFGTPSTSTELPQEIYYINQKTLENREQIIFELVSALDLQGVRFPKRQVLDTDFPGVGLFVG